MALLQFVHNEVNPCSTAEEMGSGHATRILTASTALDSVPTARPLTEYTLTVMCVVWI